MKYFYIVFSGKTGFGSFCTYAEDDFNIVDALKSAEVAANGFAVIVNWKEISSLEYKQYCVFSKRVAEKEADNENEGVQ